MEETDYTILSKEEVAKLLHCEENTIEEKARTGQLPAVKIGRTWVFMRETLFHRLFEMSLEPKNPREGGGSVHARNARAIQAAEHAKEDAERMLGRRSASRR